MSQALIRIVLVEDEGWQALRPLTWLRPAGELLVGARSNVERWEAASEVEVVIWCRPEVAALDPGRRTSTPPTTSELRLWVRDRWIPDAEWIRRAEVSAPGTMWRRDGAVVAVLSDKPGSGGSTSGGEGFWSDLAAGAREDEECAGAWLAKLSDLISEGAKWLSSDLEKELDAPGSSEGPGDGFAYAPGRSRIGKGCQIDHGAVLDARDGPIVIGPGTKIFPGTWIRGPFGCRERCMLLGGTIGGGSYLGPGCRVRGEVEASTFHGYANKAHDGFIGHSYIGEWVNLGALTTTSDLKNNYGTVQIEAYGRRAETGQRKVGSFVGDHAKTRIGAMLNTGSVIGLAANLFDGTGLFPKWTPDFAWGGGVESGLYDLDRCMQTVETVMERRGMQCPVGLREAFEAAYRGRM